MRSPRSVRHLLPALLVLVAAGCAPAAKPAAPQAPPSPPAPAATTGPAAPNRAKRGVVVAAAGDIACPGAPCDGQRETARLIAHIHPDAVLPLGDLQYPSGGYQDFLHSYDPTWGRFKGRTHPAPGNHEYETSGASGYFRYFGKRAHPPHGYYSFDLGSWHLMALNANCGMVDCAREQRWITRNLRRDHSRCELAYWHQPRWSSGPHGSDPTYSGFWNALYRAGVDVVLNGHDHDYERFTKLDPSGHFSGRGIREFVVGTGGASHYEFQTPVAGSQVRIANRFGVLRLALQARSYGWKFIATNGKSLDSGSMSCHP